MRRIPRPNPPRRPRWCSRNGSAGKNSKKKAVAIDRFLFGKTLLTSFKAGHAFSGKGSLLPPRGQHGAAGYGQQATGRERGKPGGALPGLNFGSVP